MIDIHKILDLGVAYTRSFSAFHLGGAPRPFSAELMVTNRCNLRCSYCNYPFVKSKELTVEEISVLFDKLLKMGVKRLGISGGEPMMRKDLAAIINLASTKGFFVSLNSNMLLYDKHIGTLNNVDYFFTSIDGTPEIQKLNRGNSNIEKIIEAIRDIKRMGKKITVISVISQPSTEAVDYVLNLAVQEGFDVHFQPEGYGAELSGRDTPPNEDNDNYRNIWGYIYNKYLDGYPITSSKEYLKCVAQWADFKRSAINEPNSKCVAGHGFIFIDPAGIAYPCCYTKGKVKGVNLMVQELEKNTFEKLPCSTCLLGPYLEHNLLYRKPIRSSIAALSKVL